MRKRIAEHMVRSVRTAAHCTTIVEADMSRIEAARGRRSFLPFVARATIDALREHPTLNATFEDERLDRARRGAPGYSGVARGAGAHGAGHPQRARALARRPRGAVKDLAQRARSKRLSPDELGGGTFTITNPGAFGAVLATPIINQPQVAILDLESVVKRPVVVTDADGNDSIAIVPWPTSACHGTIACWTGPWRPSFCRRSSGGSRPGRPELDA